MFKRFETLVDPYPADEAGTPPAGFWRFIWHYSRPMAPWLVLMSLFGAVISVIELVFFAFTGTLVDWLTAGDRAGFLSAHGWPLAGMAALTLIGFPVVALGQALLMFQTSFGSYPMLVRWRAHRQLLRQSLAFFQDEFAGRVSQKVMQTALAVRETVMKLMDVGVYIVTMFIGTAYLLASIDLWMLAALGVWLAAYVGIMVFFVPRLGKVGEAQADASRADDRPHRRQLHQHPDGQALCPLHPRAGLRARCHGRVSGYRSQADAPDHRLHLVGQRHQLAAAGGGGADRHRRPGSIR